MTHFRVLPVSQCCVARCRKESCRPQHLTRSVRCAALTLAHRTLPTACTCNAHGQRDLLHRTLEVAGTAASLTGRPAHLGQCLLGDRTMLLEREEDLAHGGICPMFLPVLSTCSLDGRHDCSLLHVVFSAHVSLSTPDRASTAQRPARAPRWKDCPRR